MKTICGGHFPRGLLEPVVAAVGTCFLSDTLTSRSLWGLCAVSVEVRRTVVFDSYPLFSPGKFIVLLSALLRKRRPGPSSRWGWAPRRQLSVCSPSESRIEVWGQNLEGGSSYQSVKVG